MKWVDNQSSLETVNSIKLAKLKVLELFNRKGQYNILNLLGPTDFGFQTSLK